MADKKITDFDPFNGVANDKVFFVVASGEGSNLLSKNYKYDYKNLSADIIAGSSYWVSAPTIESLYTLTGAVGIGTSTPAHKLDVAGTISGYTGKFKDGIFSNSLTISGVSVSTGMGGKWQDGFSAGNIYYNGGTVGIGDWSSTNPPGTTVLAVKGAGGSLIVNSSEDIRIRQDIDALDNGQMWLYGADDAAHVKLWGYGEALFDQRVTSATGAFTETLTLEGNPVSTGLPGKWEDGATAGDIYYDGGLVGIGMDGGLGALNITAAGPSSAGTVVYNAVGALRSALYLDVGDNAIFNLKNHLLVDGVHLSASGTSNFEGPLTISGVPVATGRGGRWEDGATAGDIYYAGGNVGVGTNDPDARLHVTGGDGRILAPSGDFTSGLFVSGVPVSTGAGGAGKWIDDPAYALGITYEDGPVAISGDLRVSGSGYFSSNTLLVGEDISLKAANDYLIISGSGIKVGDPGSEDIVLTTEKLGLGTTANLSEEPGDINFKLLTDQNRFVVGTTGQPGGDLSGWYRFNDYTVKGASDIGAHAINPVDTRIYTEGSTFMLLSEDSDGGPIGYIANGSSAISANNAIAIGIAPKLDETETPRDLEFTDTDGEVYSVINGDSDSIGVNGLPLSQGLQAHSMGAVPAVLLIDGGYF